MDREQPVPQLHGCEAIVLMPVEAINPATGERVRSVAEFSAAQVAGALARAEAAYPVWRGLSFAERGSRLLALAVGLRGQREVLARLMAEEMGKPVAQGRAEIDKCAGCCEYYAANAARFLAPETTLTEARDSTVHYQPLGVVLAVMPWNFPFWQVFRAAAPALMAGNVMVLKHASNVPGCAAAIEALFTQCGFPTGAFVNVYLGGGRVRELVAHPAVRAVTLTGSTLAGQQVAAQAGSCLKKSVMELGGSDPYLVLDDADLPVAARACATARLINGGQSCIAAKRFLVMESVREEFTRLLVAEMAGRIPGDPLLDTTLLGPLARMDLRSELHAQVVRSLAAGARLLLGGVVPPGPGAFYPPTVLTDVLPGMAVFEEETFGPVAAVTGVATEAEAVSLANRSVFGLGAAVFTRDQERGQRVAMELEAGGCFINDFVRSDPRLPFGGIKQSGYGRELSVVGIREFVNIKTVVAN
jgi:succinate-semialdehyde dehydrogenase/glutarate-semialdehyde dehydrogenase